MCSFNLTSLILMLLASYGLCFAIQHKLTILHNRLDFFDRMFACTYCTGFHTGWIMYCILMLNKSFEFNDLILVSFASSVFCYTLDEFIKYLETSE